MYDTHAHLNFPPLLDNIDEIVQKSKDAGLTGIIIASSNVEESKTAVQLDRKYPGFLYASVGIHPQDTRPNGKLTIEEQLLELEKLIKDECNSYKNYNFYKPVLVAVGETGLDFSPAPPGEKDRPEDEQYALFKGQIKLAQKYNLPLIIHARSPSARKGLRRDKEAVDEVIEVLTMKQWNPYRVNNGTMKGVFHCYAGGKKRIQKILELASQGETLQGWYFGFDGNLTYDEGLQAIVKMIPEERILIETDSPFLTPIPHRGQTNYPYFLPLIQQKINEIFGKDMGKQIEENTHKLFRII